VKVGVLDAAEFSVRSIDYLRQAALSSPSRRDFGTARSWRSVNSHTRAYFLRLILLQRTRSTSQHTALITGVSVEFLYCHRGTKPTNPADNLILDCFATATNDQLLY